MCILTSFLRLLFHSFSSLFLFSSFFLPSFVPFLIVFWCFYFLFLYSIFFLSSLYFFFICLVLLFSPFLNFSFPSLFHCCFISRLCIFMFSLFTSFLFFLSPFPDSCIFVLLPSFPAQFSHLHSSLFLPCCRRFIICSCFSVFFFFLWLLHYLTFSSLSGPAAAASIPSPSQSAGRELFPTTCSFFLYPSSSLSLAPSLLPPVFSIQKNTDLYNETWPYAILFHGGFKRSLWPWVIEKHLFNWARILFPWPCNNLMNRVVRQWMGPVPHSNCLAQSSGTSLVNRGH